MQTYAHEYNIVSLRVNLHPSGHRSEQVPGCVLPLQIQEPRSDKNNCHHILSRPCCHHYQLAISGDVHTGRLGSESDSEFG